MNIFQVIGSLDIYGAGQEFNNLSEFSNDNIRINNYLEREELENDNQRNSICFNLFRL